jgi:gliding motility-associated-like protein
MIQSVLRLRLSMSVLFMCILPNAFGQLDTEFWFAAPEVWANHGDQPILLRFSTLADAATVTVEQPANPGFPPQSLNIPANGTQTLNLTPWLADIENKPFNTVLSRGIHITSDNPVTAYYEVNHELNPDIFALKGASALGEEFYVPFQNYLSNGYLESKSGFDIVATQDGTEITIVPTTDLGGYPAGTPFTITLNEGETYALRAANIAANQHPSGTYVTSTAPIAITVSDDSIVGTPYPPGNCMDLLGDQIIPVDVAGDTYIAVKGNLNGADKVFIVGTEDNTSISVNGTYMWTVDAGETYAHTLANPAAYYETSAPVLALHLTGFGCEVGGAILPPITCTGSDEVAFVRSSNDFIGMKIIVPAGAEGDFTFNGNAANVGAVNFTAVPGTAGEWMYANITGSGFIPTGGPSRLVNSTAKFHLGIINGGATSGTRYGYFSDFANYQHSTFASNDELCAGEIAQLFASPINEATYEWTGPNGFTDSGDAIEIGPLTADNAGLYVVSGMAGECEILPDTLELFVAPQPPVPDVAVVDPLCEGEAWTFVSLTAADQWIWEDESGAVLSNDSSFTTLNAQPEDAGTYTLVVESDNCISEPAEVELVVYATEIAPLDGDPIEICEGSNLNLTPTYTPPNANWEWTLPDGSTTSANEVLIPSTTPTDGGTYTLGGTSNGCPMTASTVEVTLSSPDPIAVTAPDFVCNDGFALNLTTDDSYSGSWSASCPSCVSSTGALDPSSTSPGILTVTYASDNPCAQTTSVEVEIGAVPDATIGDESQCEGTGEVILIPTTPSGEWTASCSDCCSSAGIFDTQAAGVGLWELTYTIDGACPSTGTATFSVTPNTSSAFALTPEFCLNHNPAQAAPDEPGGTWSASCGGCITNTGQFSPENAGVGTHTVTYTITGACGTETSENVVVLALPDAAFEFSPLAGCAPAVIACEAPANPSIVDCQWVYSQNGVGATLPCDESNFVIADPGCYELTHTVLDNAGCTNAFTAATLLCLSAPPTSNFTLSPALPSIFDATFEASATDSVASNTYQWSVAETLFTQGANHVFSIPEIGSESFQICLQATDPVGCSSLTCASIDLQEGLNAFGPTAFTPDNDGHNDAWRMYTSTSVTVFEIRVYDRWGALVFASNDPEEYWVGEVQGGSHYAPDGIYHYEAVLRGDAYRVKTLQGHILLIR